MCMPIYEHVHAVGGLTIDYITQSSLIILIHSMNMYMPLYEHVHVFIQYEHVHAFIQYEHVHAYI